DLTPENMKLWQDRIRAVRAGAEADLAGDSSSSRDRLLAPGREWNPQRDILDTGEIVAWILDREEGGRREKG
ncbi:MAG: short-chain dehydrogenase, partial [Gammaproteobacteria bacterium]|nr:short-chain dehydrogenase [Gammaproteobacteria bacterium]